MVDWGSCLVRRRLERALLISSWLLEVFLDSVSCGDLLGVDGATCAVTVFSCTTVDFAADNEAVDPPPPSNEVTGSSSDAAIVPSSGLLFFSIIAVLVSDDEGAVAGSAAVVIIGILSSMAKIGSSSIV